MSKSRNKASTPMDVRKFGVARQIYLSSIATERHQIERLLIGTFETSQTRSERDAVFLMNSEGARRIC